MVAHRLLISPSATAMRAGPWPPCTACRRVDLGLGGEPVIDPVAEVQRWCDTLQTVDASLVPDWQGVRDALLRCAPTAMAPSVVHGDFRLGNLMAVGASINAVIDWEIWSIGDPRIDAGWFLINCDPDTYQRVPALLV